jgi:hypothetical protein
VYNIVHLETSEAGKVKKQASDAILVYPKHFKFQKIGEEVERSEEEVPIKSRRMRLWLETYTGTSLMTMLFAMYII